MHILTEDSISQPPLSLCLSICLSAYLFLTLPSPFLLQTNSRLKQIEKEYSQKLAKSAQVIAFSLPPYFPPLSFYMLLFPQNRLRDSTNVLMGGLKKARMKTHACAHILELAASPPRPYPGAHVHKHTSRVIWASGLNRVPINKSKRKSRDVCVK